MQNLRTSIFQGPAFETITQHLNATDYKSFVSTCKRAVAVDKQYRGLWRRQLFNRIAKRAMKRWSWGRLLKSTCNQLYYLSLIHI